LYSGSKAVSSGAKTHELSETIEKYSGSHSAEWSSTSYSQWDSVTGEWVEYDGNADIDFSTAGWSTQPVLTTEKADKRSGSGFSTTGYKVVDSE